MTSAPAEFGNCNRGNSLKSIQKLLTRDSLLGNVIAGKISQI
jgi:hypothetical protein